MADPGGATGAPLKVGSTMGFLFQCFYQNAYKIRFILHERALKQPSSFQCPIKRALHGPPSESEFRSALVMCVLAHNLLRPLHENPGSAPVAYLPTVPILTQEKGFKKYQKPGYATG